MPLYTAVKSLLLNINEVNFISTLTDRLNKAKLLSNCFIVYQPIL